MDVYFIASPGQKFNISAAPEVVGPWGFSFPDPRTSVLGWPRIMFSIEISGFAIKTFVSAQSLYHASPPTPIACGNSYVGLHWLLGGLPQNAFRGLAKGLNVSQGHPREKPGLCTGPGSPKCPEEDPPLRMPAKTPKRNKHTFGINYMPQTEHSYP